MGSTYTTRAKFYGTLHAVLIPALLWNHYGVIVGVLYHLFFLLAYSTAFKSKAASLVFKAVSPIFLGIAHGYILILLSAGHKILL